MNDYLLPCVLTYAIVATGAMLAASFIEAGSIVCAGALWPLALVALVALGLRSYWRRWR